MKEIDYALNLFDTFPVSEYDREDYFENILGLMAFKEILSDNEERFSYIISHTRFNDYCLRGLFGIFFTHNFTNENQKNQANKYFKNLLDKDIFDFPLIFNSEQKNGLPPLYKNVEAWTMLLEKLNKDRLYIKGIYILMENIFYYERDIPKKYKNFYKQYELYLLYENSTAIINNILHTFGNSSTSLCSQYALEDYEKDSEELKKAEYFYHSLSDFNYITTEKEKKYDILAILSIGFFQLKKNNIGEKRHTRFYKKTKTQVGYPSTPYTDDLSLCFNNPHTEFYKCLEVYNDIKKCGFSQRQQIKIAELYYSLFKKMYN